jgi:CRP-like cAMP-binding protein
MPTVYGHKNPDPETAPAVLRVEPDASGDAVASAVSDQTRRRAAEAAATRVAIARALTSERVPSNHGAVVPSDSRRIELLVADPELGEAVPAVDLPRARQALVAREHRLKPGRFDLLDDPLPPTTFALLVVRGVLTQETIVAGRSMLELILPGDLLLPWSGGSPAPRSQVSLTAPTAVTLAALDDRFIKAAAIWPGLLLTVQQRVSEQKQRLATHGAICQLPRVEQRLMAIMWHLAARAGRVGLEGTTLPWPLSHQALAGLVGASRPTVSLAVSVLHERGHLFRRPDRTWLLPGVLDENAYFDDVIAGLSEL